MVIGTVVLIWAPTCSINMDNVGISLHKLWCLIVFWFLYPCHNFVKRLCCDTLCMPDPRWWRLLLHERTHVSFTCWCNLLMNVTAAVLRHSRSMESMSVLNFMHRILTAIKAPYNPPFVGNGAVVFANIPFVDNCVASFCTKDFDKMQAARKRSKLVRRLERKHPRSAVDLWILWQG